MTANSHQAFRNHLIQDELFAEGKEDSWRIGCQPFVLSTQQAQFLKDLGQHLLAFYSAINRLYVESLKGNQPQWVQEYFDIGKPDDLLEFGRMNRFKNHLPGVIRPDLIPTESGMALTELDSVPGGIGLTGSLSRMYAQQGLSVWPTPDGLIKNFSRMLKGAITEQPSSLAIVVSDEADAYRAEMQWVASQLSQDGWDAYCVHPRDLRFTEERLFVSQKGKDRPISLIYRFFELFDLKNIPKGELILYSAKKGRVVVTPPYKPWMEEKLALALIHHPMLEPFWENALSSETIANLQEIIPPTWVLDPRPLPPTAVIPGLRYQGHAVSNWDWLGETTQKERQFVLKVSDFLNWPGEAVECPLAMICRSKIGKVGYLKLWNPFTPSRRFFKHFTKASWLWLNITITTRVPKPLWKGECGCRPIILWWMDKPNWEGC